MNVNLAPVLDVFRQPGNFIDEFGRSFSSNASVVARLGASYAKAEQKQGVAATVKHFPGLGDATTSQNTDERPVTLQAAAVLDPQHRRGALQGGDRRQGQARDGVLGDLPGPGPKNPAGLSSKIVGGELRKRLKFGGVTITDALEGRRAQPVRLESPAAPRSPPGPAWT